jgi:hypothetical protein
MLSEPHQHDLRRNFAKTNQSLPSLATLVFGSLVFNLPGNSTKSASSSELYDRITLGTGIGNWDTGGTFKHNSILVLVYREIKVTKLLLGRRYLSLHSFSLTWECT